MRNTLCHVGLKREVEAPVTPPSCPPPSSPRSAPAIPPSAVSDVFLLVTALRDKAKLSELLLCAGGKIQRSELGVWLAQLMWPHTLSFPRLRRGKRGRRGLNVQFCYGKGSTMCWPLNKEGVLYLGSLKLVVSIWPLSGRQNGHKIFLGQWEASVSPSGKGKTVLAFVLEGHQ